MGYSGRLVALLLGKLRILLVRHLISVQVALKRFRVALIAVSVAVVAAVTVVGVVAMPQSSGQVLAFKCVVVADLAAIYLYIGIYTLLARWWTTPIGRSLVYKDVVLSIPLLEALFNLFFHLSRLNSKVAGGVDLGALALMAVILFSRSDIWVAEHAARGDLFVPGLVSGVFHASPDAIVIAEAASGKIVAANDEAAKLTGWLPGELEGKLVEELVPAGLRPLHRGHRADYAARPAVRPMGAGLDLHMCCKDGGEVPADINLAPVTTERGLYVVAAIRRRPEGAGQAAR